MVVVIFASGMLAILNPQILIINLWGWITVEHTIAAWSLIMLALGIVMGVFLASLFIIKLQRQLYVSHRKSLQLQSELDTKESKK